MKLLIPVMVNPRPKASPREPTHSAQHFPKSWAGGGRLELPFLLAQGGREDCEMGVGGRDKGRHTSSGSARAPGGTRCSRCTQNRPATSFPPPLSLMVPGSYHLAPHCRPFALAFSLPSLSRDSIF